MFVRGFVISFPFKISVIFFSLLSQSKEDNLKSIFTGKPIQEEDLVKREKLEKGKIIIVFCDKRFVGIYQTILGENVFAKSEFVMQPIK